MEGELCPRIISREEWGARPPVEESSQLPDLLAMVFLHHSAMAECEDRASCEAALREIQDLHMDNNGWWDIGYRSGVTTVTQSPLTSLIFHQQFSHRRRRPHLRGPWLERAGRSHSGLQHGGLRYLLLGGLQPA